MKIVVWTLVCLALLAAPARAAVDVQNFYAPLAASHGELVRYKLDYPAGTKRKAEVVTKRMEIGRICNGVMTLDTGTVRMCSVMVDDGYEYALRLWGADKRRLEPDSIVCVPRLNSGKWQCAPGADAKVD